MKYRALLVIGILSLNILFSSCSNKVAEAQFVGSQFYNAFMKGKYDDIYPLLDQQVLSTQSFDDWKNTLSALISQRGLLLSYRTTSIQIFRDKDENLLVRIKYRVKYTYGIFVETLTMILHKGAKKFKILSYNYVG